MSSELVAALVGAFAVVGGIVVQNFASRASSSNERKRELLIAAYEDFLVGLTMLGTDEDSLAGRQRFLTGKQKIAAYAPKSVLQAVASIEDTSLNTAESDTQAAIVRIVVEMRKSVGVAHEGIDGDIKVLLFKK